MLILILKLYDKLEIKMCYEDTKAYGVRNDFIWLESILAIHDFAAYFRTYGIMRSIL
jgi:hypothetical protein